MDRRWSPCVVSAAIMARAVVAHQGARQAPLEKGLAQTVDEALGRLVEVPLGVADQT